MPEKTHIINVSTFQPRKCGIASFAGDLVDNLGTNNWMTLPIVQEIGSTVYHPDHKSHILGEICQNDDHSYDEGGETIIQYSKELAAYGRRVGVIINHENGIFADDHTRDNAVRLTGMLNKAGIAIAIAGHTVLYNSQHPDFKPKREVLSGMIKNSDKFIGLTPSVIHTLMNEDLYGPKFGFERGKLIHIPHGIPNISIPEKRKDLKKDYDFVTKTGKEKTVYSSLGYLSNSKGLKYTIEGFSKFLDIRGQKRDKDDYLYFIGGVTHEDALRKEGEAYRNELIELAKKKKNIKGAIITKDEEGRKNITDLYGKKIKDIKECNLVFLNNHIPDKELPRFMKASDCGVIGNLGEDQISSGPGAYWIGSSRITISTKSHFFKDMEEQGIGLLVPFRDPLAIADRMNHVADLSENGKNSLEYIASDFGVINPWSNVGPRYFNLMKRLVAHKSGELY